LKITIVCEKKVSSKEQEARLFLKLLKFSANNCYKSIQLIDIDRDFFKLDFVNDGDAETPTKFNIFD
tara:strand:+ start:220 stop:420 length:201 start_codon:yes stop_codon:yes gene_type:complete